MVTVNVCKLLVIHPLITELVRQPSSNLHMEAWLWRTIVATTGALNTSILVWCTISTGPHASHPLAPHCIEKMTAEGREETRIWVCSCWVHTLGMFVCLSALLAIYRRASTGVFMCVGQSTHGYIMRVYPCLSSGIWEGSGLCIQGSAQGDAPHQLPTFFVVPMYDLHGADGLWTVHWAVCDNCSHFCSHWVCWLQCSLSDLLQVNTLTWQNIKQWNVIATPNRLQTWTVYYIVPTPTNRRTTTFTVSRKQK